MPPSQYIVLCDAIVSLLHPLVEIVIHSLATNTIVYIAGNLSKRRVGDDSLLDLPDFEKDLGQMIYPKVNFDGRLIKSISVPLEGKWLLCINCDVSVFSQMQNIATSFLHISPEKQPESLFKQDWQERLHIALYTYVKQKNWSFEGLNQKQKKEIIHHLLQQGAFSEKKASDYIANILGVGRATVFNYLRLWR